VTYAGIELPNSCRTTGKSETIDSSVGLVPTNALLFTNIASTPECRPIGSYCWLARGRIVGFPSN
jgi:hypothetical protein